MGEKRGIHFCLASRLGYASWPWVLRYREPETGRNDREELKHIETQWLALCGKMDEGPKGLLREDCKPRVHLRKQVGVVGFYVQGYPAIHPWPTLAASQKKATS